MLRRTGADWVYWRYVDALEADVDACLFALGMAYRVLPDDDDFNPYEMDCTDCAAAELGMCELAR